jgi:hypothetical protein
MGYYEKKTRSSIEGPDSGPSTGCFFRDFTEGPDNGPFRPFGLIFPHSVTPTTSRYVRHVHANLGEIMLSFDA